jgi:hypothetical protein
VKGRMKTTKKEEMAEKDERLKQGKVNVNS